MHNVKKIAVIFTILTLQSPALFADSDDAPRTRTRTPFYVGFGVGAAKMDFNSNGASFKKVTPAIDFRIGFTTPRSKPLLGFELLFFPTTFKKGADVVAGTLAADTSINTTEMLLTYQQYFFSNLFARFGIGAVSPTSRSTIYGIEVVRDKIGFSTMSAVGYDIQLSYPFYFVPEATFSYNRIDGKNNYYYGGTLNILLCF